MKVLFFVSNSTKFIYGLVFKNFHFLLSIFKCVDKNSSSDGCDGDGHCGREYRGECTKKFPGHPLSWPALLSVHQEHRWPVDGETLKAKVFNFCFNLTLSFQVEKAAYFICTFRGSDCPLILFY